MIRGLVAGITVWVAVPICWFVWWYVHSAITGDVGWGRHAFYARVMEMAFNGFIVGAVVAFLIWFNKL